MRFLLSILFLFILAVPVFVSAHVGYVLSEQEFEQNQGQDFAYLLSIFGDPANYIWIIGGAVGAAILYVLLHKLRFVRKEWNRIRQTAKSYEDLMPWMLRLGLGIALIGAGVAEVLISPAVSGFPDFALLQILLGFLLLAGFLLAPATIAVIVLYGYALLQNFYVLGNLEFFAGGIALFISGNTKPGLDHLIGIPYFSPFGFLKSAVPLVLRIGMGGAMMFLALYEKILNPHLSELVVRHYELTSVIPVSPEMWVFGAGTIELVLGLALVLGFHTRITAGVAFLVLTLSFFYFGEEVYSHVTLFSTLSALFVLGHGKFAIRE